jgi:hypothetical protein
MAQRSKRKKQVAPSQPQVKPSEGPRKFPWLVLLQAAIIIALGVWIYYPSLHGLWLWDDDFLIQQNAEIHDARGLWYIWFDPSTLIDFFPLTVSVEWLIWQIFWDPQAHDPQFLQMTFYYHVTSLILHLVNAMLVWLLFRKLGLRLAWLGALLFTVHPVIVESVAWMAELKNTVAMPPFLLALLAWISYDRTRKWEYYVLALLLYLVAVLCKSSVVMFPVIILLYAWWKHGRIGFWESVRSMPDFERKVILAIREFIPNFIPTIPFFIIAAADAYLLIIYLRHGVGEQFIPLGGPLSRIACAGLSLAFYFSKCILPVDLMPIYPQWIINPPILWQFLPWPVLAFGFWWLWKRREQPWARAALFGFGFFFLNLLPFVGWRAISFMRFQWVMDHFLYVPILGLLGLAVAAAGDIYDRLPQSKPAWRVAAIGTVVVVLGVFTIGSHSYAEVFVDRLAYWTYGADRNWAAWPAHNNRGNQLLDDAQTAETRAAQLIDEAKIAGRDSDVRDLSDEATKNFAEAQSLYQQSENEFQIALELNPEYTEAHNNLGFILSRQGRYKEAEAQFREALYYTPDFESAQLNLKRIQQLEANPKP